MAQKTRTPVGSKTRPADLPDFERPPLVEVVLGVQFSELRNYRTYHTGLLWQSKFRNEFPNCVEKPPLDQIFETFGVPQADQARLQVSAAPGPMVPRLWFINQEETELIQVQADRFLHNWRRVESNTHYPRYEPICERFFDEIGVLESFFAEEKIGTVDPNQCEVTYVNHISVGGTTEPISCFDRVFVFWNQIENSERRKGGKAYEFEGGNFRIQFVIRDPDSNEPRGRLYIDAQPAVASEEEQIIRLKLTARGSPVTPGLSGVADFLDLGREAIVRSFTEITTPEMHDLWGRIK